MASISSLGVGSNLDLNGLLDRLESAERQPLQQIKRQQASFTAKLTGFGTLRDALETLRNAAQRLTDAKLFSGTRASVGAPDVMSASVGPGAAAGSYQVDVLQLAQSQSLAARGVADPKAPIGKGTLTLDFGQVSGGTLDAATGRYNGASFTPDAAHAAVDLVIDDSNNSLEGLHDAINKASGLGVTASIVNDGGASPFRLVLNNQATGEASSLRISVSGDAELQALAAHDPAGEQAWQQTTAAANARIKVNGLALSARTNSLTEAVPGTTLTLTRTGSSTLSISRDTGGVESAVQGLVSAYNALQGTTGFLTKYNAGTKKGEALMGDATVRQMQTAVRSALTAQQPGGLQTLSAVGVSFQKDGLLALDAGKLKAALAQDRDAVAQLFGGGPDAVAKTGAARELSELVMRFTGEGGLIRGATEGVKSTLKSLDTRHASLEGSIQSKMARYRAQFKQLDMFVSRMNSTTSYLTQQFENMAASRK
jgi:flagellar hook-associated protein 2